VTREPLVHHELCFGCGRTNLFGLLMEVERVGEGHVRGRGFVKQDHQGPVRGTAHPGVIAAALSEAMAFAAGAGVEPAAIELNLKATVPVGTFLEVEAEAHGATPPHEIEATATARADGEQVATARGAYRPQ
jgi:acyl-coenzyme A thioesterase PaaI-like protein